jgi:hypothetical protein
MFEHQHFSAPAGPGGYLVCCALFILMATAASVPALAGQDLPLGRRVRLTFADSSRYTGRLDSTDDDHVWLAMRNTGSHAVDLQQVKSIEVSRGRKPKWLLGAALGAGAGLLIGVVLKNTAESYIDPDEEGLINTLYLGLGTAGGALIGTGLSVVLARERWEPVAPATWAVPHATRSLQSGPRWQLGVRFSR